MEILEKDLEGLVKLPRFKNKKNFYAANNATPTVLKLVDLENKRFGSIVEKVIINFFRFQKSKDKGCDLLLIDVQRTYRGEIKASRIWGYEAENYKWQHVMLEYNYDFLILGGLYFDRLKLWVLTKPDLIKLYKLGIIQQQGRAEGQGTWFEYHQVKHYLFKFESLDQLRLFLQKQLVNSRLR